MSLTRFVRGIRALARRPGWVLVLILGLLVSGGLLGYGATHTQDGVANAALNAGTSMLGALITVAIIGPIIRYVQEGTVREHGRLDYAWFSEQVATATQHVQILTTFSNVLDHAATDAFLRGVRTALSRGARVRILLLNPGSIAADLRQQELEGGDVRLSVQREIMRNLRRLSRFTADLGERERSGFEVRLYDASASITLYRWDDRALVSFLPIGRFSELGAQLEVTMRSPLGEFIQQRFDELWGSRTTVGMAEFLDLTVTLVEDEHTARQLQARYVEHEGDCYVIHTEILAAMARRPARLQVFLRGDPSRLHDLFIVDSQDPELHQLLQLAFVEKYDVQAHAFVGLRPASG
ncbi:DUF5919 domain-containing protein [Dactylosporangium sp. CA-092794]|uniref:DUF5919 domain-containing protein n=1 Tax=Dactylosporangium sp. CA-092794 TaxID=3239929 RepID=UPI003D942EC2